LWVRGKTKTFTDGQWGADFCNAMESQADDLIVKSKRGLKTLYNLARPFGVLGGVNDKEIDALREWQRICQGDHTLHGYKMDTANLSFKLF
jgi:hypothetical protein